MKKLGLILFCITINTCVYSWNFGIKLAYSLVLPLNSIEEYDGIPILLNFELNRINLDAGIVLCREIPGKKFVPRIGYLAGLNYSLLKKTKYQVYISYTYYKNLQKKVVAFEPFYVERKNKHQVIRFLGEYRINDSKLFLYSKLQYTFTNSFFAKQIYGSNYYNSILADFGVKINL